MSVYDRAHELAMAVRESEEYREYDRARRGITAAETARSILRDYRMAQLEVQAFRLSGKEPPEAKLKDLERLSGIVELHKPIIDFLRAEGRLLTLVGDIQKILGDALDLWDYGEGSGE